MKKAAEESQRRRAGYSGGPSITYEISFLTELSQNSSYGVGCSNGDVGNLVHYQGRITTIQWGTERLECG